MPSYTNLRRGEEVQASMRKLADGYFEMQEYEFALYAYKYLLFHNYERGFNKELICQISICLEELEMDQLVTFLNEYLMKIEQHLGSTSQ